MGTRRHPVLRPGGVLRPGRLCLGRGRVQLRTRPDIAGAGGGRAGRIRRRARLLHVLRQNQRCLSGRDHAGRHADPLQPDEFDLGRQLPYRPGAVGRIQRHSRHPRADPPGANEPVPGRQLHPGGAGFDRRVLRTARRHGFALWPRGRRRARERATRPAAGLQRQPDQAGRLHAGRRARRTGRHAVRQLGRIRQSGRVRAVAVGSDHHLGTGGRARHADRTHRGLRGAAGHGHAAGRAAGNGHRPGAGRDPDPVRATDPTRPGPDRDGRPAPTGPRRRARCQEQV